MRRKRHEPLPPAALDEPFGPPPEEYRCRCPVCGEEMWVNEAGIVSKPAQKLVGRLTLFQGVSQVLSHHKTT